MKRSDGKGLFVVFILMASLMVLAVVAGPRQAVAGSTVAHKVRGSTKVQRGEAGLPSSRGLSAFARKKGGNNPGIAVHDVTYNELTTLIAGHALVVGDQYRLTDFRTRYTIPKTTDTHAGAVEVLLLTANSQTAVDLLAVSERYPQDIIYYTLSNDTLYFNDPVNGYTPDPAVDRGYIVYRKDVVHNVEVGEDFRNMVFRRWRMEDGSGLYASVEPLEGAPYQDFPLFADYEGTSEVHIDHHRDNRDEGAEGNYLSNIVFRDRAYKVEILDGAENATFLGSVVELSMKFCSKGLFYGSIERAVFGTSSELTVTGDLYSVYINKSEMLLDGNFRDVEIFADFAEDTIVGDYSQRSFGGNTENIITLTPADDEDVGGNKDNPYLLGTQHEDTLVVDPVNLASAAFIIVNRFSPLTKIQIAAKGTTYVAFDGVPYSGNAWTLVEFNGLKGWKIEGEKTLTLDGATGSWSTESQNSVYASIIAWDGGADGMDGYEKRYSLNSAQYEAVAQAAYDEVDRAVSFAAGVKATVGSDEVESSSYGGHLENRATNSTTDGIDKYGLYIGSTGAFRGGDDGVETRNYGLYVDTPTGADTNYAAIFAGGRVGVGTAAPEYTLDVAGDLRIAGGNHLFLGGEGAEESDVDLYRNRADQLKTDDQFVAADGVANKVNAGPCDDSIFTVDTDGLTCIDSTTGRLYFRYGGEWHYTAQTSGFEIAREESYAYDISRGGFDLLSSLSVGDFLMPLAESALADGAIHGVYTKWSDVKQTLLHEEQDQLSGLAAKTEKTIESIDELATSVGEQLPRVFAQLSAQEAEIAALKRKIAEGFDFSAMEQQQRDIDYLEYRIGVSRVSNATDMSLLGGFSAERTETGALSIRGATDEERTIGRAVICPLELEVDDLGECTVVQNDGDNDGLDDISGNPMGNGRRAVIKTSAARENSRIFLTPRRVIDTPLVVSETTAGQSFTVEISHAVTSAVSFDWWIVDER